MGGLMPHRCFTGQAVVSDIVEAWMWRDPEAIIEPLLRRSERADVAATKQAAALVPRPARVVRDRYYTMWRRLHVKHLMKGR
jgi:hypothetical protein